MSLGGNLNRTYYIALNKYDFTYLIHYMEHKVTNSIDLSLDQEQSISLSRLRKEMKS